MLSAAIIYTMTGHQQHRKLDLLKCRVTLAPRALQRKKACDSLQHNGSPSVIKQGLLLSLKARKLIDA